MTSHREPEEFTCAVCEKTYAKETPEEEALSELGEVFGDIPVEECDIVCDDCWLKMRRGCVSLDVPTDEDKK